MIGLLQRVERASVIVAGEQIAAIGRGLLVLVAVRPEDDSLSAERLGERLLGYRVFADAEGRMNHCLIETGGELLLVPQFTLAADTRRGSRPGFSTAAEPAQARRLFDHLLGYTQARHPSVACGRFGADMAVELVNDGPVTFWIES